MRWRCAIGRIFIGAVLGALALAAPAAAQTTDERNGAFSCRASLLKLVPAGADPVLEPVVSNEQGSPCADDEAGLLSKTTLPPGATDADARLTLGLLFTSTDAIEDDLATPADELGSHAESGVAFVLLSDGSNVLIAQIVTAEANGRCVDGSPKLSGNSSVVSLTIIQPGAEPTVIAVPPDNERLALPDAATDDPSDELALHLNETIEEDTDGNGTDDKLTQRAVWLESPLGDIIVGEAVADFSGNPCEPRVVEPETAQVTVVKDTVPDDEQDFDFRLRSDGGDDEDGDEDFDQTFVLDDDGDAGNEHPNSRTFEVPAGEVRIREREVDGYSTAVDCEPDQGEQVDDEGRRAEFQLEAGETVTCTFTNAKVDEPPEEQPECSDGEDNDGDGKIDHPADPGCENPDDDDEEDEVEPEPEPGQGTIEIRKGIVNTDPDGSPPFEFQGTDPIGEFFLSHNEERELTVDAGQYEVTEVNDPEDGFRLWRIECDEEAGDETQGPAHGGDNTARIDLDPGEDITCSFYNARDDDPDPGNEGPGNANPDDGSAGSGSGGSSDSGSGSRAAARMPLLDRVLTLLR